MVNNLEKGDNVYLDTGFLVAYSLPEYQGGKYTIAAKRLMAEMIIKKCNLMVSTLSFDELWKVVRDEKNLQREDRNFIRKINNIIKPYLSINTQLSGYSYSSIMNDLKSCTEALLQLKLTFLTYDDNAKGILSALALIQRGITNQPRDSFHASLAIESKVDVFVSRDKRLIKGMKRAGLNAIDLNNLES